MYFEQLLSSFFVSFTSFEYFFSSSVKSDTKWLSWLAYRFHIAANKHRNNNTYMDDSMDLETFANSFYFKVVCI